MPRFFPIRNCKKGIFGNWKRSTINGKEKVNQQQQIRKSMISQPTEMVRADGLLAHSTYPQSSEIKNLQSTGALFLVSYKIHQEKGDSIIDFHFQLWLTITFLILVLVSQFYLKIIWNRWSQETNWTKSSVFFFFWLPGMNICKCNHIAVNSWEQK